MRATASRPGWLGLFLLMTTTIGFADAPAIQTSIDGSSGSDDVGFSDEASGGELQAIAFGEDIPSRVREGYVSITWADVPDAARYEVIDRNGSVLHSGVFSQAFISGLPDGIYHYRVRALSGTGEPIAITPKELEVEVSHWPYRYVVPLLLVGLFVMLSVVGVIVAGQRGIVTKEVHP
ncbi:hypothetical protein CGZ80_00385 [Rhodopirellula sp. MGV]|nr:hypothetical protein CGZ80_00385 [Rhodopirellula sp. MGV]PNY35481.1 hypothetical protein C2E31_18455 [Rhodopirellula baltica]